MFRYVNRPLCLVFCSLSNTRCCRVLPGVSPADGVLLCSCLVVLRQRPTSADAVS
ncbi:hypothetical protein SynRS9907_01714 [Synechococcus sp. RS9907]|nr:hypothetical protein SynRS9907_01714 [Synechococcus sp. RS9907]